MATDIKPIHNDSDHAAALAEIERLWGAPMGSLEGDRLDVLATLIDAYEADRFPVPPSDPVAAIEFRMEQQGLTPADLEPMIGSSIRVAEVLARKCALTLPMIRRLHEGLGIPADVLIREFAAAE